MTEWSKLKQGDLYTGGVPGTATPVPFYCLSDWHPCRGVVIVPESWIRWHLDWRIWGLS